MYGLIRKKRDGKDLSRDEIFSMVAGYVAGEIPDYQIAAWLMVPYLAWLVYAGILTYRIAELNPGAETLVPSSTTTQII